MHTVLAWVPPKAEPDTEAHLLVVVGELGPEGPGVWHMDVAWRQRKSTSAADRTDHCHGPHCSLDPTGPPEKLYKRFLRPICPGKKDGGVQPLATFPQWSSISLPDIIKLLALLRRNLLQTSENPGKELSGCPCVKWAWPVQHWSPPIGGEA